MVADNTAELTDGELIDVAAVDVLAVFEILLYGSVREIARVSDNHRLGEVDAAAGTDAVVEHLVAHVDAARLADGFELALAVEGQDELDVITGATITSKAIQQGVEDARAQVTKIAGGAEFE